MISHEHKCIFIHIPKCAGTSIESKLGHLEDYDGRFVQDHRSIRMIEQPFFTPRTFSNKENLIEFIRREKYKYLTKAKNHRNKFTVDKNQFNSYYKFTIIRNPWARAYSWYKNVLKDEVHLQNHKISKDISFHEFLSNFAGQKMLKPQLYWIKSFNGSIPLDFIGRFENLQKDTQHIFEHLNLSDTSLPHMLKGSGDDYRKHYNDQSIEIIAKVYKEDIETFNYTFD